MAPPIKVKLLKSPTDAQSNHSIPLVNPTRGRPEESNPTSQLSVVRSRVCSRVLGDDVQCSVADSARVVSVDSARC